MMIKNSKNMLKTNSIYDISEFVKENPASFDCRPSEFLKLLSSTFYTISQNVGKPIKIAQCLKNDFPNRVYFLQKLEDLSQEKVTDYDLVSNQWNLPMLNGKDEKRQELSEALAIIRDERIKAEQEKIQNENIYQKVERMSREAFAHIATLNDEVKQLKRLKKTKIEIDAELGTMDKLIFTIETQNGNKTPYAKLEKEIEKREALLKLEKLNRTEPKAEIQNGKPSRQNKDLTLDRAALFFNYLLNSAKANCHNTKKVEIISFFTGYSTNTLGDKLSRLHSKADDKFIEYEKDMNFVRRQFETLGMREVVEKIDKDLDFK